MKRYFKILGRALMIEKSNRKGKQLKATTKEGKEFHFGDPKMPEYPSTNRGDRYCKRTISLNDNSKINPNTLSRKILWKCKGKKSMETFKDANIKMITKEDFFKNE